MRYARDRLAGLDETGNRGATPKYDATHSASWPCFDEPPAAGYANWTAPLLARARSDVHEQYISRFLQAQKIDPSGRKSLVARATIRPSSKAADIVGLSMAPPDNAIVLSIDEKPSIQALEQTQGYLKLPNGRTITSGTARRPCLPRSTSPPAG